MTKKHQLPTMLILAALAAILLLIIIILNNQFTQVTKNERLLVGSLFIIISLGGIYSAFRPGRLKRLFQKPDINKIPNRTKSKISLAGHHPECKPFDNHSFHYKNTEFCTGCYGLAVGSIIAIITICVYIFSNMTLAIEYSIILLSTGFIFIVINYIETLWYHNTILFHLVSNVLLITGFLLIVISTTEITGEASYGIIAIVFSGLWLDVRIHLSQYKHQRICQLCPNNCVYFK